MKLTSVNIGRSQPIAHAKPSGRSGIFKQPVDTPVLISTLGLQDDVIVDTENHGGPDQAVYIYGSLDYDWWSAELQQSLAPGTFGENLTISELESAPMRIGDRLRIGLVLLEVTSPRIPCVTLSARMGDPRFLRRFVVAGRPGVYCRVLEAGSVRAGDEVMLEPYSGEPFTAAEMFRYFYTEADEDTLRRALTTPLHDVARAEYEERLERLLASSQLR